MAYHKKKIIWLLVIYIIIFGLLFSRLVLRPKILTSENKNLGQNISQEKLRNGTLRINQQIINIEIAEKEREWYRGLSNRTSLCADCGMLFNFSDYDKRAFVMRDMKFPLDIIFIKDNHIINIAANLVPEGSDTKNIYYSDSEANRVLEVSGGYCEKYGIKAGDLVLSIN